MTAGPLFEGAAFTGIVAFSMMTCVLGSLGFGTLGQVCTRSPLAVRLLVLLFVAREGSRLAVIIFFTGGERCASSATNSFKMTI